MLLSALTTFELANGETLVAEALTTTGILAGGLPRFSDAKRRFEAAHKIARRRGTSKELGLAFLMMLEELATSWS
jgi:hypothetical protein